MEGVKGDYSPLFGARIYQEVLRVDTTMHPRPPSFHILSKPPGLLGRRLLLIKPDRTFNEIIQGLFRDGKAFRAEVIAQKIKSSAGPGDQGLMQGFLYKPRVLKFPDSQPYQI